MRSFVSRTALAVAISSSISVAAYAAEGTISGDVEVADQAEASDGYGDEIVVTARRRAETAQALKQKAR